MGMLLVPADSQQVEAILDRVGTSERQLAEDIGTVQRWLGAQPHLPQITDDELIKAFLVGCKGSLERTKQKLDAYYTVRNQVQQFYNNRDPCDDIFRESLDFTSFAILPQLAPDDARVVWTRLEPMDHAGRYDIAIVFKRILATLEFSLRADPVYHGAYYVLDAKNVTFTHATRVTPTVVRDMLFCINDVIPVNLKGFIFFNSPPFLQLTVNTVLKPFLKKKLADRIHIYAEDHRVLSRHFPIEMLPKDYGGRAESVANLNRAWAKLLESHRNWLITDGCLSTDESKRPEKCVFRPDHMFGTEGSFKKLSLD